MSDVQCKAVRLEKNRAMLAELQTSKDECKRAPVMIQENYESSAVQTKRRRLSESAVASSTSIKDGQFARSSNTTKKWPVHDGENRPKINGSNTRGFFMNRNSGKLYVDDNNRPLRTSKPSNS